MATKIISPKTLKTEKGSAAKNSAKKKTDRLGDRVKWKRKAMGYSQPDLAKLCDVSTSNINNIERHLVGLPRYIKRLADVLDTSIEYLVNGQTDPSVVHIAQHISLLSVDTPIKPELKDFDYHIVKIKKGQQLFVPKEVDVIGKVEEIFIGHKG
tara:strand:- start:67 stop:528 length:462 start_codon:yes stop_codon:yes gene_type:complete